MSHFYMIHVVVNVLPQSIVISGQEMLIKKRETIVMLRIAVA